MAISQTIKSLLGQHNVPQEASALEDGVRMAREAMSEVGKQAGLLIDQVNHVVETGKAHTQGKPVEQDVLGLHEAVKVPYSN